MFPVWESLSAEKARPQKHDQSLVASAESNNDATGSLVTTRSKFTILLRITGVADEDSRTDQDREIGEKATARQGRTELGAWSKKREEEGDR